jgi:hypothetical protein
MKTKLSNCPPICYRAMMYIQENRHYIPRVYHTAATSICKDFSISVFQYFSLFFVRYYGTYIKRGDKDSKLVIFKTFHYICNNFE